jgi:hypothetical protein
MRQPDIRAAGPVNSEPRWPAGYIEVLHEMPRQSPQPASSAAAPPAAKSTSAGQVVRPTAPVSAGLPKRFPGIKRIVVDCVRGQWRGGSA